MTKKTRENDSNDDDHGDNSDITSNLDYYDYINTSSGDIDDCESEDAIYEASDFTFVPTSSTSVKTV